MSEIKCLITVRSSSTRLANKCFLKFGGGTVIDHLINRSIFYGLEPIVCTSTNAKDNKIIDLAKTNRVLYFRGSENNKLLRWYKCAREFNLEKFHTIDGDDLFFCGDEIKRSMSSLNENIHIVEPNISSSSGAGTVGYSIKTESLEKISNDTNKDTNTEMIMAFIKRFENIKTKVLEEPKFFKIDARMTLDYWEDYIFLECLRIFCGNNASRKDIYKFLKENENFKKINLSKSVEWANRQKVQYRNIELA